MPNYPHDNISIVRSRLIDGMKDYREAAGDACGYIDRDIDQCVAVVDAYLNRMTAEQALSQEEILDAVKKAVLDLNSLNQKCNGDLIETDQREDLCQLLLTAAVKAGLQTNEDVTEQWREW